MRWDLDQLLALPVDYYEVLMEEAPKWLAGPDPDQAL